MSSSRVAPFLGRPLRRAPLPYLVPNRKPYHLTAPHDSAARDAASGIASIWQWGPRARNLGWHADLCHLRGCHIEAEPGVVGEQRHQHERAHELHAAPRTQRARYRRVSHPRERPPLLENARQHGPPLLVAASLVAATLACEANEILVEDQCVPCQPGLVPDYFKVCAARAHGGVEGRRAGAAVPPPPFFRRRRPVCHRASTSTAGASPTSSAAASTPRQVCGGAWRDCSARLRAPTAVTASALLQDSGLRAVGVPGLPRLQLLHQPRGVLARARRRHRRQTRCLRDPRPRPRPPPADADGLAVHHAQPAAIAVEHADAVAHANADAFAIAVADAVADAVAGHGAAVSRPFARMPRRRRVSAVYAPWQARTAALPTARPRPRAA